MGPNTFMRKALTCLKFGRVLESLQNERCFSLKCCQWAHVTGGFTGRAMHLSKSCDWATKTNEVDGNCRMKIIEMKLVSLTLKWSGPRGQKRTREEVDKLNARNYVEKQAPFFARLQGLIGLPVMTSLTDNAIHHPLWRKCREGWGYGEIAKVMKAENKDTEEERKQGEETGRGSVETCQGSAPLPLSQWANEHSRVELMRCWR